MLKIRRYPFIFIMGIPIQGKAVFILRRDLARVVSLLTIASGLANTSQNTHTDKLVWY